MKLLVLFAVPLLVGCSVQVAHETEDEEHKSRTTVAVDLNEPTPFHEPNRPDAIESAKTEQSQTTLEVIVSEQSPVVFPSSSTTVTRSPDRSIQVAGDGNTVVLGDVHLHHHEHKHFHVHETPKPSPVQVDIRVEVGDRLSERERRRRMVENRISRAFPRYRD